MAYDRRMSIFTPWESLAGGALIGASASLLLMGQGRVAGISGIVSSLFVDRWRLLFVAGLIAGGVVMRIFLPLSFGESVVSLPIAIVAGLLVGVGTKLGSGCTSGHGVCGMSRFSKRSAVATATFMTTGILTTIVASHLR